MKKPTRHILPIILVTSIAALLSPARAGTNWDGGGADDLWGTGGNWDGDTSPLPGAEVDLTFDGLARLTPNNNYTAFDDFHSITFAATAGSFTLSGSAIDLFGKIENYSTLAQTVAMDLAINAGQPGTGEFNPVNGDLFISSANVFTNGNTLHVYGVAGKTVTFGSGTVISGTGALNVEQASNVVLLGANTYTGTTNVLAGSLTVGGGAAGGTLGTGVVTVAAGAKLGFNRSDATTLANTLNIGGALVKSGAGTLTISGAQTGITGTVTINAGRITMGANNSLGTATVTLNGGTLERSVGNVTVANNLILGAAGGTLFGRQVADAYTTFSGAVSGGGPLTIQGLVVLSNAANTYAGNITISNAAPSFLRLSGSNRIGATSNVTLTGGNANFRLDGPSVTQTIAALNGTGGRVFSVGTGTNVLTVGNTDANGAYAGTMDTGGGPLSLVKIGSGTQSLERAAGNGAVLTGVTVNSGTLQFAGTAVGFNAGYFTGATPITVNPGGILAVRQLWNIGSANPVTINGGTLNFNGTTTDGTNYVNNLTLQNGATVTGPGGYRVGNVANTLTLNSTGDATNTIATNLYLVRTGGITTYALNVADGASAVDLAFSGNIYDLGQNGSSPSLAGMILNKTGAGRLQLSGTSIFTGATTITAGTLTLGAGGSTGSLAGSITNDSVFEINRGDTVTIANAISGTGTLVHAGPGTTTLTGANTYTGPTLVNAGALVMTPAQTGATSIAVADGAAFGVRIVDAGTTLFATSLSSGTATGATLLFDTATQGNPVVAMLDTGTFNPSNGTQLKLLGSNLTTGTFTLLDYGTLSGAGFAGLALNLPFRVSGSLADNVGNTSLDVTIASVETVKWQGGVAGGDWDIDPNGTNTAGTTNWKTSVLSTPTRYAQGPVNTDSVTFDDTATGTTTVNLTTSLTPLAMVVNNTATAYTFIGAGSIGGTTGLVKTGDGTLIIANTTANEYTGGTTISGGILQLGDGVTVGGGSINGAITNDALLVFNRPDDAFFTNAISGSGSLLKNGAGHITLISASSYAGGTVIRAGRLEGTTNSAFGSGTITLGDADTGPSDTSLFLGNRADISNPIVVSAFGTGTVTLGANNTGSGANPASFLSSVTLERPTIFSGEVTSDRLTFDGQISGNVGTLTVTGGSRTTFASTLNDFVGDILITGAGTILQASVATTAEVIPDASSLTVDADAVLQLASSGGTETINALNGAGTVRTFIGGFYGAGLAVGAADGSGLFSGTIINGTAGNPLSLIKLGTGTQTLTGLNTYSGGTTISGGTLEANGDTALGDPIGGVTIENNAILKAGGSLVTASRTLTLGASGGTIDTNGNDVTFDIGSAITGAATLTKIGAGTLTIGAQQTYDALTTEGGMTVLASELGTGTSTIIANADIESNFSQTLTALTIGEGAVFTLASPTPAAPPLEEAALAAASVQPVPEPGVAALLISSLAFLGRRRRRA